MFVLIIDTIVEMVKNSYVINKIPRGLLRIDRLLFIIDKYYHPNSSYGHQQYGKFDAFCELNQYHNL